MHRLLATLAVLAPLLAAAQDMTGYGRALADFNAGRPEAAAPLFFELSETAREPLVRGQAEYYLARSFLRLELPVSALITYAHIVNTGPSHPSYLLAVEGLVEVQQQLEEQNLVPNILDRAYVPEVRELWGGLPREVQARINYLVGTISQRRGRFQEARALLEAVPPESHVYARARYLLGVVLADPRYPGRPAEAEALDAAALAAFREASQRDSKGRGEQRGGEEVRQLALLGLGRVHYGRGEYAQASAAYEAVRRYSRFWDQALFENGFARFQNEDYGGALGSLQALHAPQFAGAFQPESWILKATVYYYACLYDEVKTALAAYDATYGPMARQLAPFASEDLDLVSAFNLVAADNRRLPAPVYLWVRQNERIQDVRRMIERVDAEKRALHAQPLWRGTGLMSQGQTALEEVRGTLLQVGGRFARSRLLEAARNLRTFADQAELIRVQTALDEKEVLSAGVDQKALLERQNIYRPRLPGAAWQYWQFQGEFWRDEIGYYQYTLKRGCPRRGQQ